MKYLNWLLRAIALPGLFVLANSMTMENVCANAKDKTDIKAKAKVKSEATTKHQFKHAKPMSIEDSLKHLKNAKRFEDAVIGEAMGHSPTYVAYQTILKSKVKSSQLMELVKQGSPAGKLYGAALLLSRYPKEAQTALNSLKTDTTEFEYKSGCKVCGFELGKAAKDLLETGKFINFKIATDKSK